MSKFHIHKDEQQQGPFTLDELRDLKRGEAAIEKGSIQATF